MGSIAPSGFEPLSPAPKASMLGHYTTGLRAGHGSPWLEIFPTGTGDP